MTLDPTGGHMTQADTDPAGRVHDRRTLGVIADTHGLLRPEAADALAGCEAICLLYTSDAADECPAV